jgi:hypothetical protein
VAGITFSDRVEGQFVYCYRCGGQHWWEDDCGCDIGDRRTTPIIDELVDEDRCPICDRRMNDSGDCGCDWSEFDDEE